MDNDEKELVRKVEEEQDDFYAPLMALCLYRFQKETKLSRQLPTEGIQKLVLTAYKDLSEFER